MSEGKRRGRRQGWPKLQKEEGMTEKRPRSERSESEMDIEGGGDADFQK